MLKRAARLLACLSLSVGAAAAQAPAQTPAAASARAPTSAPMDDVEGHLVEELVVHARLPGPAWWRVSNADSTVYVLGLPDALPKDMVWDHTILDRRLAGADRLITPPTYRATISLLTLPKLLWDAPGAMRPTADDKAGEGAREGLGEGSGARLAAAAQQAGRSEDAYRRFRPWFAGLMLTRDYRRRVGLDYGEPMRAVRAAARRANVPVQPAFSQEGKASALLKDAKVMPTEVGRACLDASLEEVEAGDTSVRKAAQAWAQGDVRVALSARRSSEVCYAALPGAAEVKRDSLQKQADAIEAALARPGHAVAALSLRSVLAKGGVLDRLRAKGFNVHTPE